MRFFTVGNAREARKSVVYATGFIAYFWIIITVVGFGAIAFLNSPDGVQYFDGAKAYVDGGNAREARKSVVYATGFIAYFWIIITVVVS